MISNEQLEEFKRIYRKQFGRNISDQDVLESATKLLDLLMVVYKPMTREEFSKLEERRKKYLNFLIRLLRNKHRVDLFSLIKII